MFLNACMRVAGLRILSQVMSLNLPLAVDGDLCNWFCSSLRNNTNNLTHYLNNIKHCGNYLEGKVRTYFFKIYE